MTTPRLIGNTSFLISLLAFIEGGNVMLAEIGTSNLLAAVFGNTVQLWSSVIGASLAGLAVGYHIGGKNSIINPHKTLLIAVCALIILNVLLPFVCPPLSNSLFTAGSGTGLVISGFVLLFPILFFCGMISPLLIRIASEKSDSIGLNAGRIFFISTVGGIAFTLLYGLYAIPVLGLKFSFISISLLQCISGLAAAVLLQRRRPAEQYRT